MANSIFGPRILGKEKFQENQEAKKKGANIYGPRVLGGSRVSRTGGIQKRVSPELEAERAAIAEEQRQLEEDRRDFDAGVGLTRQQDETAEATETDEAPTAQDGTAEATATEPDPETADADENGYLSEAEIAEALEKQPELYDRLVQLELARSKGPRKGVSKRLLEFEQTKREGGPRVSIVKKLTAIVEG